ncbi:MAG: serine/threonine-protein kinase [Pirellulaceae bacterium]|nr:serine/threonine-protein kinase [Pirellulaceae bacterium]
MAALQVSARPISPPAPARKVQAALGDWRLVSLIGEGRWTRVFRAEPASSAPGQASDYAIKTLCANSRAPIGRAILRREALVCREVRHPQLTALLADHATDAQPHLVLPYLEGLTLRKLTPARIAGTATALWIARQAAEALAALHDAGWLHGDVRPENVRVSSRGQATLTDLGLARRIDTPECAADPTAWTDWRYTAPEAFASRGRLAPASDIYSLGIVLFELLTGRPPFDGPSLKDLAKMQQSAAPPSARDLRPELSREVAELLGRLLAKEPLRRPSGAELVRSLAELEIAELAAV